jgi:hypothetical protein
MLDRVRGIPQNPPEPFHLRRDTMKPHRTSRLRQGTRSTGPIPTQIVSNEEPCASV